MRAASRVPPLRIRLATHYAATAPRRHELRHQEGFASTWAGSTSWVGFVHGAHAVQHMVTVAAGSARPLGPAGLVIQSNSETVAAAPGAVGIHNLAGR